MVKTFFVRYTKYCSLGVILLKRPKIEQMFGFVTL